MTRLAGTRRYIHPLTPTKHTMCEHGMTEHCMISINELNSHASLTNPWTLSSMLRSSVVAASVVSCCEEAELILSLAPLQQSISKFLGGLSGATTARTTGWMMSVDDARV